MIRVRARVDDVANRPIGALLDRRHDRVGLRRRTGIDDHDAIRSDLDADVAAGADDHVEVRPQLEHFEAAGILLAGLLGAAAAPITPTAPAMATTAKRAAAAIATFVLAIDVTSDSIAASRPAHSDRSMCDAQMLVDHVRDWQILPRMTSETKLQ